MAVHANAPIIIKRKKIIAGGGHHGGAWKVAYADFVTAMMAFFMLMWLLNATTEQQRKGIADYFSPKVPISRVSGGGDGMFGGDTIFSQNEQTQTGTGVSRLVEGLDKPVGTEGAEAQAAQAAEVAALQNIEETLLGKGGESILSDQALRHVITRLTDEGLIIEIFDTDDSPLFEPDTATPTELMTDLSAVMAQVFGVVKNEVAVSGHTASRSLVVRDNPNWPLSTQRALAIRGLLVAGGLSPVRTARVVGYADRKLVVTNPMAVRNNRIEITLLRSDQPRPQSPGR